MPVFAPKTAKPQAKVTEGSTSRATPNRSTLVGQSRDATEQALFLQRTIGDPAALHCLTKRLSEPPANAPGEHSRPEGASITSGEPTTAWDFRTIPVFAPERTELPWFLPRRLSPGILAIAEAIREATVENRNATSPTLAHFAAAATQVRMRHDASANRSARLLGADAIAFGDQILFRDDRFEPRTERGHALIAHELTHVAYQRQARCFRPQCHIGGDVLFDPFTPAMAQAMTEDELLQQMNILRAHLRDNPRDARAAENLSVLESVVRRRHKPIQFSGKHRASRGNPGILQGYELVNGVTYARYKAIKGTWVSASLLDQGYVAASSAPAAYELAAAYARTSDGKRFSNPDRLAIGQEFLIQSKGLKVVDFSDEPAAITGQHLPETDTNTEAFKLGRPARLKHWFVDPKSWVNIDSHSTDNYPSFELQGPSPPATVKTPEDRVAFWLALHKSDILKAEERWHIPREAIAGIIAWEAIKNPQAFSVSSAGPGKMHLEESGGWPQEIEKSGRYSRTPDFMKKVYMENPLTAIMYIGAGLDLVATMSEKHGWDVRHNPELLGHIYHAYKPGEWDTHITSKTKGEAFKLPPGGMGDWIKRNLPYLRAAVGTSSYGQ